MANHHNYFKISDLPNDTKCTLSFLVPGEPIKGGVFFFTLYEGCPLRKLLELQEIYEESFERGVAAREAERTTGKSAGATQEAGNGQQI